MKCIECGKAKAQYKCSDCSGYFCKECAELNDMRHDCFPYPNIKLVNKKEVKNEINKD